MHVRDGDNQYLRLQYLIINAVRKSTRLTTSCIFRIRMPSVWKILNSGDRRKRFEQEFIAKSG